LARARSLSGLPATGRRACHVSRRRRGPSDRVPRMVVRATASRTARPVHRLVGTGAAAPSPLHRVHHTLSRPALGGRPLPGLASARAHGDDPAAGLDPDLRPPDLFFGNVHRSRALSRHVLPGRQLDRARPHDRARQERVEPPADPVDQRDPRVSPDAALSRAARRWRSTGRRSSDST
jgi:hypothetical protein